MVKSRRVSQRGSQKVASKNVRRFTPEPCVPGGSSAHVLGSSAPLSVEVTSTRCTLIAGHSSSKGGVVLSTWLWKASTSS